MSRSESTIITAVSSGENRRRTKIVATLGPATDEPSVLERLFRAGVDVVRINFSHGAGDDQAERVARVREVSAKVGRDVAIMGDLQGPKIRIESFKEGFTRLTSGQKFTLDTSMDISAGTNSAVGVAYERLVHDVDHGDIILLNDGQIELVVDDIAGQQVRCTVVRGGVLSNRKGLNMQGGGLSADALTDKDRNDIAAAARLGMDFVAVSFVRSADDMHEARRLLRDAGGHGYLVAKIERVEAVANIDAIIDASDAVMVARGDLAVEVGYASMTGLQKGLIHSARLRNKVSITATQMLESMIKSGSPTRAEVSDVANAVLDGTDAVMLSAETAVGENPVEAVRTMSEVCIGAEKHETTRGATFMRNDDVYEYVDQAIAMAVMYTANHLHVGAIIALTESGSTALWMSRRRSDIPIYAFTRHEATRRRVSLYRGVYPVSFDVVDAEAGSIHEQAIDRLVETGDLFPCDLVIFTTGQLEGIEGGTNTMQIFTVPTTGKR
jgi:pyruvate kinase